MTRVKICGITNLADALAAVAAGADALGFVLADSPRRVSLAQARALVRALPPFVCTVGVLANAPRRVALRALRDAQLGLIQLHGAEPPAYCQALDGRVIKSFVVGRQDTPAGLRARLARYRVRAYLLDSGGGSGRPFRWEVAGGLKLPLIIAGGLTPENVAAAIRALRPYAVDVCSGVEVEPGRKDGCKMRDFIQAVRGADEG